MIFLLFGLGLNLDIAQFYQAPKKTICEIYYSMPIKELKFKKIGGKFTAEFPIILRITDEITKETFIDTLHKEVNVSDLGESVEFSDVQRVVLASDGRYNISLVVESIEGKTLQAETTVVARKWDGDLILSDVQISHTLIPTSQENRFIKSGYKLIPFPRREFDRNRYLLASYCELYGLQSDSVLITYIIQRGGDGEDTVYNDYYDVIGDRMAIPMISNVLGYPLGSYTLKLIAHCGSQVTVSVKGFFVKKFKEIATLTIPDSIMEYASFINYISSSREVSEMNSLSPEGRKLFLHRFWNRRDPTPATRENEALNEFVKRVKYSDEYFTLKGKKGRFTDFGRIYIKYGPPDDIVRRTMEMEAYPYVIWHYFDRDNWFIFMDKDMSGEYYIIYSNVEGGPTEPGWTSLILLEDRSRILGIDF